MFIFGLFCFFGMGIAFLFSGVVAWKTYKYFLDRKRNRALRLLSYQKRLKSVVAELLKQINELDQISKYSGLDTDAAWSRKYDDTLKKLLSASEKLTDAQTFADMKELNASQESLLCVVRTIHVVNYTIKQITPRENFDGLQQEFSGQSQDQSARASGASEETISRRDSTTLSPSAAVEGEAQKMLEDIEQEPHDGPDAIIYLYGTERKHD